MVVYEQAADDDQLAFEKKNASKLMAHGTDADSQGMAKPKRSKLEERIEP